MFKIDEPVPLNDVAEFHRTFKLPIISEPGIPSPGRCSLRLALLEEELKELREAIDNGDIIEAADAFCDLQYVLSGAILEFGLGSKFKALFNEVHRSNMSKACSTEEVAQKTVDHYAEEKGMKGIIEKDGDQFLVYRENDGKVLKSIEYTPADLENLI